MTEAAAEGVVQEDGDVWLPARRAALITDVVVVIVGVGYAVMAYGIGLGDTNRPGPGMFPAVVGALLVLAAAAHLFQIQRASHDRGSGDARVSGATEPPKRVLLVLAALAAYLVLLPILGHLVAAAVMTAAVLRLLGTRTVLVVAGIAVATAFASDLLFTVVLGIELPAGPLGLGWAAWI